MKVLLQPEQLLCGVTKVAEDIGAVYGARPVTMIAIMTGSIVFMADLIRRLHMPLRVGVVQASSYRHGTTRGTLSVNAEMMPDITGHDVILVDDIFDTGHTLHEVVQLMSALAPSSIRTAVLLRKAGRSEVALVPDFIAFEIPNEFVVGYGLDYLDEFRNLPYLASLEDSDLKRFGETR